MRDSELPESILRTTPNRKIGLIRALKMTLLFLWMLLDMLEQRDRVRDEQRCSATRNTKK